MKNETLGIEKLERKVGLSAATLPWWAKVQIAQHTGEGIPSYHSHHRHHCIDCDCIMICSDKECRNFQMSCPECSESRTKKPISQGGN